MNLFAQQIKFEDTEGLDYPEGQLITEGDEGESVAAAVAEVTEEEAGLVEDERAMDSLVDDEETLSEVQEVVQDDAPKMEHAGLTPTGARLAKIILTRVVGKRHANKTLPKMEHFNSRSDARDATSFVTEGVSEALKSFWEALKAQFKKIWAKMKTWAIKTFSAARQIAERAKTIRGRAESASSTIDKKQFAFAQAKQLVIDGRLKSSSEFSAALTRVVAIVDAAHQVDTDKAIDALADDLEAIVSASGAANDKIKTVIEKGLGGMKRVAATATGKVVDDKVAASFGDGENGQAEISTSDVLPGDRAMVLIDSRGDALTAQDLRMSRIAFANTKNKPKEIASDVEAVTLNPSEISKFCDQIAESADQIADFEAKWQKTDKAQETLVRKIEQIVKEGVQENKDDDNGDNKKERDIRSYASSATQFVKRVGGAPAQIAAFALPVYAATLNWCEGSMRNYKK